MNGTDFKAATFERNHSSGRIPMLVPAAPQVECMTPRERVFGELLAAIKSLQDPRGVHPVDAVALSPHIDELEMCATVLAMPEDFRELGRNGIPLLWPWPAGAYQQGQPRRQELLQAAALLIAAVERLDRRPLSRGRPVLCLVSSDDEREVGLRPND